MKRLNLVLVTLMVPAIFAAGNAYAVVPTSWNWGGYVQTSDSPVIGGWSESITGNAIKGFGLIANTGTATSSKTYSDGTVTYLGTIAPTCPLNTAKIQADGYVRADTGVALPNKLYVASTLFNSLSNTFVLKDAVSYVCVTTDTY